MANAPKLDLSNLTDVDTVYRRKAGQPYDLAFSPALGKFRISNDAFDKLGIPSNGFKMQTHPEGYALLALVPEEEAAMFGRRMSNGLPMDKGKEATNRQLFSVLEEKFGAGADDEKGNKQLANNSFALIPQGLNAAGQPVFLVFPWEEGQETELTYSSRNAGNTEGAPAPAAEAPTAPAPAAAQATAPAAAPVAAATPPVAEAPVAPATEAPVATSDDLDFGDDNAATTEAEPDPFAV